MWTVQLASSTMEASSSFSKSVQTLVDVVAYWISMVLHKTQHIFLQVVCSERHKSTQKRIYFVQLDLLNYSDHPQNTPWFSLAVVELCSIWRNVPPPLFLRWGGHQGPSRLDFFSSFSAWLWVWHLELWAFLFSNILLFLQEPLVFADSLDFRMTTQLWNQKSNRQNLPSLVLPSKCDSCWGSCS